ncbi:glycosyltransferase family 2 protein [Paenibacillus sp. IB182496]|uniref:Glycosyltransferase family 2 protein n=1 Tax=Paenibacillus sabuli TaxID=2772509 RepID=A0A927GQC4_9BACL|nr:glycosyltransferase family 2 protein [Paenibacillus sabuli]MBD2844233.1 glycosyltransferase family 2 protein [Paenibacillus sabuli]
MVNTIIFSMQVFIFAIGLYQMVLGFYGWRVRRRRAWHKPQKSFAVLVAAHNEEQVVGALIENLLMMKYPRKLFDIFVICDNCSDGTADVVRRYNGVHACVRTNPAQRGKGYAIEWMLGVLWKQPRAYDAVVMFDADNLVSTDFLQLMNNDLCNGVRVIQGYLDTKNPQDSWVSAANGINYWFTNRMWQVSRANAGLANFLGGTGMCFESKLLQDIGWGAKSLVEDLEFTIHCIMRGVYPRINYDARVYDEKPISFKASARQRLRWTQGHFDVARKYFLPLLWRGIRERSFVKLDAAFYVFNAYTFLVGLIVTVLMWIVMVLPGEPLFDSLYELMPYWVMVPYVAYSIIQFPLVMMLERVKSKSYLYLLLFPVYLLSWAPITVYAFFTQNNKQWSHTEHTRVIRFEEVQSKQAG